MFRIDSEPVKGVSVFFEGKEVGKTPIEFTVTEIYVERWPAKVSLEVPTKFDKYVFERWSDDVKTASRTVELPQPEATIVLTAYYTTKPAPPKIPIPWTTIALIGGLGALAVGVAVVAAKPKVKKK